MTSNTIGMHWNSRVSIYEKCFVPDQVTTVTSSVRYTTKTSSNENETSSHNDQLFGQQHQQPQTYLSKGNRSFSRQVTTIKIWVRRQNPEDRVNRKPEDQKNEHRFENAKNCRTEKMNITV